jgi:hypothetical protein
MFIISIVFKITPLFKGKTKPGVGSQTMKNTQRPKEKFQMKKNYIATEETGQIMLKTNKEKQV